MTERYKDGKSLLIACAIIRLKKQLKKQLKKEFIKNEK
jgi:hypothetical protein